MRKLLIVVDMQNDFITGSLGSAAAEAAVPNVCAKVKEYRDNKDYIIFTRDTHAECYPDTQEGKKLPVAHCIKGTNGHEITKVLDTKGCKIFDKPNFGSLELADYVEKTAANIQEIELCGLCTDICVVSNALILKAKFPEVPISVSAKCCAGVTEESHKAAILTMRMCQINIVEEDSYV